MRWIMWPLEGCCLWSCFHLILLLVVISSFITVATAAKLKISPSFQKLYPHTHTMETDPCDKAFPHQQECSIQNSSPHVLSKEIFSSPWKIRKDNERALQPAINLFCQNNRQGNRRRVNCGITTQIRMVIILTLDESLRLVFIAFWTTM